MDIDEVKDLNSEAGIVATLVVHPDYAFFSENLKPDYFTEPYNRMMYAGITSLACKGVTTIDKLSLINIFNATEIQTRYGVPYTQKDLEQTLLYAPEIARNTVEEYRLLADGVCECAFRRKMYRKLMDCTSLCLSSGKGGLEQQIYSALDNTMLEFTSSEDLPIYSDVVDSYWEELQERQESGAVGIPFKFPTLNEYATIEPGELFIFGAQQKAGKSIMLLNCAVDLLKQNKSVLYIDSELNTRLFTCRLLSHLTRIPFKMLKSGKYSQEDKARIEEAIAWLKTKKLIHIYLPTFDVKSIYTSAKRAKHTIGLDVIIIDYFKGSGEGDSFASYQELGRLTDIVKNSICGDMDVAGLGAAQATSTGKLADSAKVARNASTIAMITDKTPEEIAEDGTACGNKKLRVVFNRNGEQMRDDEYIDLQFNGNLISYTEAKQHKPKEPY